VLRLYEGLPKEKRRSGDWRFSFCAPEYRARRFLADVQPQSSPFGIFTQHGSHKWAGAS
jgi:hypothetical protein